MPGTQVVQNFFSLVFISVRRILEIQSRSGPDSYEDSEDLNVFALSVRTLQYFTAFISTKSI